MNTTEKAPTKLEIPLTPIESNQIASIGYSAEHQTLAIVFKRGAGAEYQYPDVSPEQWAAFNSAESKGSHFGKHIKQLPFERFEPAPTKGVETA